MKAILRVLGWVILLGAVYLLFWPVPVVNVARRWRPRCRNRFTRPFGDDRISSTLVNVAQSARHHDGMPSGAVNDRPFGHPYG